MNQEVTRKQFVGMIGLAIISLLGIPAFMGALTKNQNKGYSSGDPGYGLRNYGP